MRNPPFADCSSSTPRNTVMNCFGNDKIAAIENTMTPIPQVEKTAVLTIKTSAKKGHDIYIKLTVTGYSTQPRNQRNLKPSVSNNLCQTSIKYIRPLKFFSTRSTTPLECTTCWLVHEIMNGRYRRTKSSLIHPGKFQQQQYQSQSINPRQGHTVWR